LAAVAGLNYAEDPYDASTLAAAAEALAVCQEQLDRFLADPGFTGQTHKANESKPGPASTRGIMTPDTTTRFNAYPDNWARREGSAGDTWDR